MRPGSKILLFIVLVTSFSACLKKEEFSPIPEIEYVDFILFENLNGELTFNFTDGDGNVGFRPEDTLPPYDRDGEHYYNFFMEYLVWEDGEFVKKDPVIPFFYRIPYLEPEGKNKSLQGVISIRDIPVFPVSLRFDTVKFSFYMEDRAFNRSNILMTPAIIRPEN